MRLDLRPCQGWSQTRHSSRHPVRKPSFRLALSDLPAAQNHVLSRIRSADQRTFKANSSTKPMILCSNSFACWKSRHHLHALRYYHQNGSWIEHQINHPVISCNLSFISSKTRLSDSLTARASSGLYITERSLHNDPVRLGHKADTAASGWTAESALSARLPYHPGAMSLTDMGQSDTW